MNIFMFFLCYMNIHLILHATHFLSVLERKKQNFHQVWWRSKHKYHLTSTHENIVNKKNGAFYVVKLQTYFSWEIFQVFLFNSQTNIKKSFIRFLFSPGFFSLMVGVCIFFDIKEITILLPVQIRPLMLLENIPVIFNYVEMLGIRSEWN